MVRYEPSTHQTPFKSATTSLQQQHQEKRKEKKKIKKKIFMDFCGLEKSIINGF